MGEHGTLVVPTFTFAHEVEEAPIIDPANDPSEMGAITEAVRGRPQAMRSTAFRHSFAAIGRRAEVITQVDPRLAVYDFRSSFGVMLALDTQILLLGITYSSCTSHHFGEWVCDVPYRQAIDVAARVKRADGTIVPQVMTDYQPFTYTGTRHTDFNRLGKVLEERGVVGVGAIGNAVVRRFAMRDLISTAQVEAAKDYNVFRTDGGDPESYTPLDDGAIVLSPEMLDGAGRPNRYQWSVVDETQLTMPRS